ncbi:MAG: hyaluronan mediated motility receptor [Marine Group I thaumarchaeote]|nr:MAG: hyaluronan mediated motility receptor [Marine Group I thaumarchaeote]
MEPVGIDEIKDLGIEKEKIEKTQKTAKIQDLESRLDKVEKEIQKNTQSKDTVSKDE